MYSNNNPQPPMPDNFVFEQVDPSADDYDSDSDAYSQANASPHGHGVRTGPTGLKPGKKTKGRVKIKMEFIENKLRRYTTFSKRKTGIMKKAYELSTLTGTQVMLLVASETGHVYTFATRKLQPIITSESGKALIQTCLNSPDSVSATSTANVLEQRMNPSGFEETDLSCALGEEDNNLVKPAEASSNPSNRPVFPGQVQVPVQMVAVTTKSEERDIPASVSPTVVTQTNEVLRNPSLQTTTQKDTVVLGTDDLDAQRKLLTLTNIMQSLKSSLAETTQLTSSSINTSSSSNTSTAAVASIAPGASIMQLPIIYQQGFAIQPGGQSLTQPVSQASNGQALKASLNQVVSALHSQHAAQNGHNNQTGELNTPLPAGTPSAINIMQGMTPGIVMYHTPQGVVYATPTQNIQDRTIFNFPQPAAAISMTQGDQANSGQQIITIPVPVSLSGPPLLQLAQPPSVESASGDTKKVKQPPLKKVKK